VGDFIDDEGNAITYELVAGEGDDDNGVFRIVKKTNNSQLQAVEEFDFEEKDTYSIRVRATLDGFIEEVLTITVINEEEPPTDIILSESTVDRDAEEGDKVGTFSTVGGAPVPITYQLLDDADEAFQINGSDLEVGDDFEDQNQNSFTIEVRAIGDGEYEKTFTISVNSPANQPPTADAGPDQTVTDTDGDGSEDIILNGTGSSDTDGTIESYVWSEGGSQLATGATPTVTLDVGEYTLTLTVTDDQGDSDTDDVSISVVAPANESPVANAGPDQTLTDEDGNGTETVTLDGSASSDNDGTIENYAWSWPNGEGATGVAPEVTLPVGETIITLTVTDDQGDTDIDEVIITVNEPVNQSPIASAGPDQTVVDNDRDGVEEVMLNGSGSSDPDGTIVNYFWRENDEEGATLAQGDQPVISMPVGNNLIALVVEDNDGATASDAVMIYVEAPANQSPVANAGADQAVTDEDGDGSETVTLDGSGSSDDVGIVSYVWSEGGTQLATGVTPNVTLEVGEHILTLTVTDEQNESDTDNVEITVNEKPNQSPTANAGPDQTLTDEDGNGTEAVTLDGSASSDNDGTIELYTWTWNGGSTSGEQPEVTLPVGQTTVTLTVTDNKGGVDDDEVEITINAPAVNQKPIAKAGNDQTLVDNDRDGLESVKLNGSDSTDPDGTIASYSWRKNSNNGELLAEGEQPVISMPVGDNLIALVVEDNDGATASDAVMIYVDAPPLADAGADQTVTDIDGSGSENVTLDGSASKDDDGTIDSYFWTWDGGSAEGENPIIELPIGITEIKLEVTDNEGIKHSDFTNVRVEAPQASNIRLSNNSVEENKPAGTLVGSFDADGIGIVYELLSGSDDFRLDENRLLTNRVFDFESSTEYQIEVEACNRILGVEYNCTKSTFTITIENVVEDPANFDLSSKSILENQPAGTEVGEFSLTGTNISYSLVTGSGDANNDLFTITKQGQVSTLRSNAIFDFEGKSSYSIRVQASNGDGTRDKEFTITVEDEEENQSPVADAGNNQTVVDSDRSGSETVSLDGSGSSDDVGVSSYAWSWPNGGSATGEQPTVTLPVGQTIITLTVTDEEGLEDTDQVTITVNEPVNQPPTADAGADQTVTDEDGDGSETVTLDGSGSSDDFGIATYAWSWPGGAGATGTSPEVVLPVGETTLTLTVTDEDGESDTDQVKITVEEQPNETPTADAGLDQTLTDENGDNSVLVTLDGSASSDSDGSIASYSWSWPGGDGATGQKPEVNLPVGQTTITLTVTDDRGATDTDQVKIKVDAPASPTFTLTNSEVSENEELETLIGRFTTESPIALSYSLPEGEEDNSLFKINNNNELVTNIVFDYEEQVSYTISVLASYPVGSAKQEFTINILNVLETPTSISLDNTTVAENEVDATVGNLSSEGGQGTVTFTLTGSNNDNNLFVIEGDQLKTKSALNFESKSSLTVEVTATSDGSISREFTIEVTNVEEPPTDITITSASVNENEPKGTLVGRLSTVGGSVTNPILQFADGNNDNNLFRLNGERLSTNAVFDREEKSSYKVRIRAVGDGSLTKDFTITVSNVNDAPQVSVNEDRIFFAEGDDPVKILSDITVTDVDNPTLSNAILIFSDDYVRGEDELITDADHQWNNNQGKLTINGPISLSDLQNVLRNVRYKNNKTINPTSSTREIEVLVNDGALNSNTERVLVLVDNPNVPPSLTDFTQELSEDQSLTLTADQFESNYEDTDNDFPNKIYIQSAPNEGTLAADGQTITNELILENRPNGFPVDFATVANLVYTPAENFTGEDSFRWTVSDEINFGNEAIAQLSVLPVNDPPEISAPDELTAQENSPLALTSISFSEVDDDVLTLTLTVSDGYLTINPALSGSISVLDEDEEGVKRLQASANAADLAALMQGISYLANQSPDEGDQLQVLLSDAPSNPTGAFTTETSITIVITPTNDPPVLSNIEDTPVSYEENGDPVSITQALEIADEEEDTISEASLTILNASEGDELLYNGQGIESSFSENTLFLQGEASLSAYQEAIRSVQFVSSDDNPNPTERLIEIQVTDTKQGTSNVVTRVVSITPVDDPTQIVQVPEEAFYILGTEELALFDQAEIIDPDNETLSSLILQFEEGAYVPEFDSLLIQSNFGLSVVWNDEVGTLEITGLGTLADYQSLLRSVLYSYAGTEESEKVLTIITTTEDGISSRIDQRIRIVFNQVPQLTDLSIEANSGQILQFTADDFLGGYADPDNFPTTDSFEAISIRSLPQAGQLRIGEEIVTEDQLGDSGLLIFRDDISALSYVMPTNDIDTDQFSWNATDGAEFATENATVDIAIKRLVVNLTSNLEEVCQGLSVDLTAAVEEGTAPFTYEWTCDQPDCGIVGNTEQVTATPTESGSYRVIVTDANGIQVSSTITVIVSACDVVIPTGFTPNGDNINDTWELQNINTFEQKIVEVYDRYGNRIFFSETYNTAWDGSYQGKILPAGTYYYRVDLNNGEKSYQGQVTILK
jgi:gliding motility-associated-like protein